ncbi:ABC-type dipeptide/oligopeptide/nickel transport system permease subunit [Constrictibacter sp. MBR-5]|uniref:ABC transporter permease n=1 Tax=Constrictibacter sp. MBR-5 TaxID=3156467 RepID=UPI0033983B0C
MTISQSVPAGGPVGTPGAEMDAGEPVALPGRAGILRRLAADPIAAVAALLLAGFTLAAVFAPWIAPYDPYYTDLSKVMVEPGAEHWFGTDPTGRDILSRCLYGARNTLLMGLIGVVGGGLIGGVMGICAAFYSRLEGVLMRLVDILLAFPAILIGLAVAAISGPGLRAVIIALVIATIPDVARVARSAAVGVMGQEFMTAGQAVGVRDRVLIWRYLTLNCISTIFVFLTLRFGQIILIGSALSFLGLGAQPPTAELGMMAAQGRDFLFLAPHVATIPSLVIFVIVLAANLVGDALRDALDPRLQH